MSKVASGIASASIATPDLAAKAVNNAIKKAGISSPTSVLLFLTSEFAADPQSAIKAAAKAANCTQVVGCSAIGIFTDEDWVLDSPAAVAMVFEGITLNLPNNSDTIDKDDLSLTLVAPNAIDSRWLNQSGLKFGGISGDATGQGSFSVWKNAKGATQDYCEVVVDNTKIAIAPSHGLKIISKAQQITQTKEHDLCTINNNSALENITQTWHNYNQSEEELPYHRLMAIHAKTVSQLEQNEYKVCSIISCNENNNSVTLTTALKEGDWLSWAVRDTDTAQTDIVKTATKLQKQLNTEPKFALLFSCLGRGPYFYESGDQDLALLKALYPNLPIIGFYGNGEIAPILGQNEILQYSVVLALFSDTH